MGAGGDSGARTELFMVAFMAEDRKVLWAWPAHSFMGGLPRELHAPFLRLGTRAAFVRGEVIIVEKAATTAVYLIMSGFARVINNSAGGESAVIAIRTGGDLVGELAALDGRPRTSTVIAASRTTTRMIDGALFRSFAAANPSVGEAVSRSVVGKLRTATRYRADSGPASVFTRVVRVLEHLAGGYGRPVSAGILIDLPLPQCDLASLVGTSEKGVVRAYAYLRKTGVIATSYRKVTVLDLNRLRQLADSEDAGTSS